MVAWVGLLMPVIGWSWTRDPQAAGHDQGAVDLGGHAPVGVQVHAPRIPKAPNRDATCSTAEVTGSIPFTPTSQNRRSTA